MAKLFFDLPSGFKMPAIGLGTRQEKGNDDKELSKAIETALELGYRHFDTAFLYGNEQVVGKVLNKWIDAGKVKRDELFVTTKLPTFATDAGLVEEHMKKSLTNLQLNYVDLYLVHFPIKIKLKEKSMEVEPDVDHVAVWKKMEEQVDAGRAKSIGLSNFRADQIARILKSARIKPANLQIEVHVYLQQRELVDFCHKNAITVVAYAALATPQYNLVLKKFGRSEKQLPNLFGDPTINKIAQKHGKTAAQVALRYLIQLGIAPIPKSVTPKRQKENIDVFDFKLDDEDMKTLRGLDRGEKGRIATYDLVEGIEKHPEFPYKPE